MLVLGALLGVAVDRGWGHASRWWHVRREMRLRRSRGEADARQVERITTYYRERHRESALYRTATFPADHTLPMLADATLGFHGPIDPYDDAWLCVTRPDLVDLGHDKSVIRRRRAAGADLWDDPVLMLDTMVQGDRPLLEARVCNYFAYVTFAERVRSETLSRRAPSTLLDTAFVSLTDSLAAGATVPLALSGSVACVFTDDDGTRFIGVQRRSARVVDTAGQLSLVPAFGLESNVYDGQRSRHGVLFYNFVKEFLEEYLNQEEVIKAASSQHAHPDWIFDIPWAAALLDEAQGGSLQLELLDLGLDLAGGSLLFAMAARFDSPTFFRTLRYSTLASWESDPIAPGSRAIQFWPLEGDRLRDAATPDATTRASLFTLDLLRRSSLLGGGPGATSTEPGTGGTGTGR